MKLVMIKFHSQLVCWSIIILSIIMAGLVLVTKNVPDEQRAEQHETTEQGPLPVPKAMVEAAKIKIHTVQDGETLSAIAGKYTIDIETLQGANEQLASEIYKGDQLVILPGKGVLYTAESGDTLWHIANAYGIDIGVIMVANNKANEQLLVGEQLFIPGGKKMQSSERQLARADAPVSRSVNERFVWPTVGELTSGFGYRWGRSHEGIDLANDIGTAIRAARAGCVIYAGWYSGYGYAVVIEHDQGYTTLYGHLSQAVVQKGQYIKGGQLIAYMGSSGNSTGSHLHFEVRKNGTPINPYSVLP